VNRGQGVATGVVLLLGALLRPGGGHTPVPILQAAANTEDKGAGRSEMLQGDGPWEASCRYWEPARGLEKPSQEEKSEEVSLEFKDKDGKVESKSEAKKGNGQTECEQDRDAWGIPEATTKVKPQIIAIIAAVPDPVHTHLALGYDRAVDALMQAAADNGYLRSFYWIPWKNQNETGHAGTAAEFEVQRVREEQPGLIVLKHVAKNSEDMWSSYDKVIYLFLVGESPASGMNGMQMRNALRYEKELLAGAKQKRIVVRLSMRSNELAVIGSEASGAAASLREAVEQARAEIAQAMAIKSLHVRIAGATETMVANHVMNEPFADAAVGAKSEVEYVSFGEDTNFEERRILDLATGSGYRSDRFAVLIEDGTVFGQSSGGLNPACPERDAVLKASSDKSPQRQRYVKSMADQALNRCLQREQVYRGTLVIRFPREISLLRNAQTGEITRSAEVPSPYLHLSLKDPVVDDTIPHFSPEQTPLSQEAALMSIQRDLLTYRAQFLAIYASNVLDEIFLANFLHRACPNVRLVFLGAGDLLWEREVENQPYIGSLTITPYDLVGLMQLPTDRPASRAFPDALSESIYNAASYTFHDEMADTTEVAALAERPKTNNPVLAGYQAMLNSKGERDPKDVIHASLWATVVGSDGYYPLGIVSHCASDSKYNMPSFTAGVLGQCEPYDTKLSDELQQFEHRTAQVYPSLLWTVLSVLLGLYCVAHAVMVMTAQFWSPLTRDLAIGQNDQPGRRSVYMNIGAVMLFLMAFVLNAPLFFIEPAFHPDRHSVIVGLFGLLAGLMALACTLLRTSEFALRTPMWGRFGLPEGKQWRMWAAVVDLIHSNRVGYLFFNGVALGALVVVPWVWCSLCSKDIVGGLYTKYGIFFSYRCLHPDSGVSPVVPVLLLLLGWYLWAVCQTYRLRFSKACRPHLPRNVASESPISLFVSDDSLEVCGAARDNCLYENISCLLITRETLQRLLPNAKTAVTVTLAVVYIGLFVVGVRLKLIESVDRIFLLPKQWATVYEGLVAGLLIPLGTIALAGWLRMVLVWTSLRRGLLERLEMVPLRVAFTRLKGVGWVAMMRETGLHQRWRGMARANESIGQLIRNGEMREAIRQNDPEDLKTIDALNEKLRDHLKQIVALSATDAPTSIPPPLKLSMGAHDEDLPEWTARGNLHLLEAIDKDYAAFCEVLLRAVLLPYWTTKRGGFVEGESMDATPIHAKRTKKTSGQPHDPIELHAASNIGDPEYVRLAEELLALQYQSLIRAVLGNIRYLMTFIAAVFVLALVAWNSYPFQPRKSVDWVFTIALVLLGGGVIWVFAQMHRNTILSRITDTSPNELGLDFYWRLATFGAVPLLTWLAYQFPQIGSGIFRIVQPGLSVIK
jgi:hypothetical protein